MILAQIELYQTVVDVNKKDYGVGLIERIDEQTQLIFIWYDEVETMVHYTREQAVLYLEVI